MTKRIIPLDGLRAICALGVIWIHLWAFYGTPKLKLANIDIYKAIAFLGNGVDFFFVISGFCMYLVFAGKKIDMPFIRSFAKKRALRILPAFFAAVLIYSLLENSNINLGNKINKILLNCLMLQNFFPSAEISGPFWSIATEWHFYLIIPFLYMNRKMSIVNITLILMCLSLIFYSLVNLGFLNFNFWEKQIIVRFPEFGWGILAGYYFKNNFTLPKIFAGWIGILLGFIILYAGRVLMVTEVLNYFTNIAFILKTLSNTIMTLGFAILMFLIITQFSILSRFLSLKPIVFLGKISYSIYLWHSAAILFLDSFLRSINFGIFNPLIGFCFVLGPTLIFATISYFSFESFYVKNSVQ